MAIHSTRVAVLRGGLGDEFAVSLRTGAAVLSALDTTRFSPIDVIVTKTGEWLVDGVVRYPEQLLRTTDVVFIALHGTYGEDGTVQRLLDRFSVPYTGSRALPSAISMNKDLTKSLVNELGVKQARHRVVKKAEIESVDRVAKEIVTEFGPEYVVKPVASGSSVGTFMVKDPTLLPQALSDALQYYDEVMVEARIYGREATCGVIENFRNQPLYALPPIEIIPPRSADFFDHTVKYNNTTAELCPATFCYDTKAEIEDLAKAIHQTLGLSQYSRSDFIVADDGIYFLETNTLPGLTTESLFPKALAAVGSRYDAFITHLLTDALERWRVKC
jgi:D-alanine-D-alanine ligase